VLYMAVCRLLLRANDAFLSFLGAADITHLTTSLGAAVGQRLEKYKSSFPLIPWGNRADTILVNPAFFPWADQHRYMRDMVVEYVLHYLVPSFVRWNYQGGHRTVVCAYYAEVGDLPALMLARRGGFPMEPR